jgi:hypothetical protein
MRVKTIIFVASSFVIGAVAGYLWAMNAFMQVMVAKEVELAAQACQDSTTLAYLRLNNPTNAIARLENQLGRSVYVLAHSDQLHPPSAKVQKARDQSLVAVKVYYQNFPLTNKEPKIAALVNPFLEKIPGRDSDKICDGAICRLDDMRQAALKLGTNSTPSN